MAKYEVIRKDTEGSTKSQYFEADEVRIDTDGSLVFLTDGEFIGGARANAIVTWRKMGENEPTPKSVREMIREAAERERGDVT